ncbi:MAG: hypothetical protein NT165_01270 [Candidatus Falkowbacteria bacterium]|nr:hypothetical protein [Candidatus Falkowbacteria bacterium]
MAKTKETEKKRMQLQILIKASLKKALKESVGIISPQDLGNLIPFVRDIHNKIKEKVQTANDQINLIDNAQAKKFQKDLNKLNIAEEEMIDNILKELLEQQARNKESKELRSKNIKGSAII